MCKRFLFYFLCLFSGVSSYAGEPIYWIGGGVSLFLPSNTLNSNNSIGFNDVSTPGFGIKGTFDWKFQPTLSLGAEVGFLRSSIDQQFWNVDKYGSIEGSYLTVPILVNTKILFSTSDIRPYFGVLFGANLLHNSLNFTSNYDNIGVIPNYQYTTTNFRASISPELGVQFKLSKKSLLYISSRYTYIANLEPTVVYHTDENNETFTYTRNAHGRQNFFEFTLGLQFAKD